MLCFWSSAYSFWTTLFLGLNKEHLCSSLGMPLPGRDVFWACYTLLTN